MAEQIEYGWKEMARITGYSLRSLYRRKKELQQAGVIGYTVFGRPPRKWVRFYPDVLKAYITRKNIKNEKF